ncbi:discoidin domain-containing protein [Streptosporangium canum]|uniref:discoidin domain-containing protein n=1 Tax=Streptosporangium canum TaxID=324952 RepID=UPI0033AACD85
MHSSRSPGRHSHRLILLVAAVVTLITSLSVIPAATAADTLLSRGRPVTASSAENVAFPATAAVDGDPGTRWSSAFSDPQWIQVDLGSPATINRVVLDWEGAYATAFTIQTSADGAAWTTIHTTTAGTGGDQTLNVSGTGRYVRLTTTGRATQYGSRCGRSRSTAPAPPRLRTAEGPSSVWRSSSPSARSPTACPTTRSFSRGCRAARTCTASSATPPPTPTPT